MSKKGIKMTKFLIAFILIITAIPASGTELYEVMHVLRQVEISTGDRTIHGSSMSNPPHRSEAAEWAYRQRSNTPWIKSEPVSEPSVICTQRTENGAIERITGGLFGSTKGAVGAAVGGLIGHKISNGKDVGTIVGVIVGNKVGNNMDQKQKTCYIINEER